MERATALKVLRKLLGPEFGYRINPKAASADERFEAKALLPFAVAEKERLSKLVSERHAAILKADAEYQSLRTQCKAATEHVQKLNGKVYHKKITVGNNVGNLFFSVKAKGDSVGRGHCEGEKGKGVMRNKTGIHAIKEVVHYDFSLDGKRYEVRHTTHRSRGTKAKSASDGRSKVAATCGGTFATKEVRRTSAS